MTRVHVLAIAAGLLLAISEPSFAAPQSRHSSGTHSPGAVTENRRNLSAAHASILIPGDFSLFNPRGLQPIRLVPGSTSLIPTDRMAILVIGSTLANVR
jgi:hypothetical protein